MGPIRRMCAMSGPTVPCAWSVRGGRTPTVSPKELRRECTQRMCPDNVRKERPPWSACRECVQGAAPSSQHSQCAHRAALKCEISFADEAG